MQPIVRRPIISFLFSSLSRRRISSSSAADHHTKTLTSSPPFSDERPDPTHRARTRTPLEKQFESWINNLKPGFTPADVNEALKAQTDPDLALDIFRWTGQQRGYKHNHVTYLNMINIAVSNTFALNMIIKAYSKCLEVDEALHVFREMGLYGCEPDAFSYGYIVKGLCEKGRVNQGLAFFKEMRNKGFIPKGSAYMILVCSLALERRFEDAIEVVFDMLDNSLSPDQLTYKTVMEELSREGRGNYALELLEEFKKRDSLMNEKTYKSLLNTLYFLSRD